MNKFIHFFHENTPCLELRNEMNEKQIETIHHEGRALAMIVRSHHEPHQTSFLTASDCSQQVGFIVHLAGHEIARHIHPPCERVINDFMEVIFVKRGKMFTDIYNPDKKLIATREIETGDLLIMLSGGHCFRMLEDTVLLEIKQGPEAESRIKEFF